MALICMVVYSTEENNKDEYLRKTLLSLSETVNFGKHRLVLSVNGMTEKTKNIIGTYVAIADAKQKGYAGNFGPVIKGIEVIYNDSNLGTAEALNKVLALRKPGEACVKIDDDIIIEQAGWVDIMEEAIDDDPQIGIIGLKRKDLLQSPSHPDQQYKSELILLPHTPGAKWIVIERTADIIGSCTMFNPLLLDKIGYSRQPGRYGFEDNLMCHRSHLAGFYNCFLPHIEIDHIDPGGTPFQAWKEKHSSDLFPEYHKLVSDMINGKESIYYNPFEK